MKQSTSYFYININNFSLISSEKERLLSKIEFLDINKGNIREIFTKNKIETEYLKKILNEKDNLLKLDNLINSEEISTWLSIQSDTFDSEFKWTVFLKDNNLLNSWISGKLKAVMYQEYYERSRDFGIRTNDSNYEILFNGIQTEISKFKKYFEEIINERSGDRFYYKQKTRMLSVIDTTTNKVFKIGE